MVISSPAATPAKSPTPPATAGGQGVKRVLNAAQISAIKEAQRLRENQLEREAKREAEEVRKRALQTAEKERKKAAEARRKAAEAEALRLLREEEELEREAEVARQKLEAEKLTNLVLERQKSEEEQRRKVQEEIEAEKEREREALKKRVKEERRQKFEQPDGEVRRGKVEDERPAAKRRGGNFIVAKFEGLAKFRQSEEQAERLARQARERQRDKAKEVIKRSAQKLVRVLSKAKLSNRMPSKEKMMARENSQGKVGKRRNNAFASRSRETLLTTGAAAAGDGHRGLKRSKSWQRLKGHTPTAGQHGRSTREMRNYLISNVLFDGQEDVVATFKKKNDLDQVEEDDEREREARERQRDEEEIRRREQDFDDYKREMEAYLSLFDEQKEKTEKKKDDGLKKKPIRKLSNLKDKFISSSSANKRPEKKLAKNVGKLKAEEFIGGRENEAVNKKEYVPVVIDSEAFKRTMGRFEEYRAEEDQRERLKAEAEAKRKKRELEEQERRPREMESDEEEEEMEEEEEEEVVEDGVDVEKKAEELKEQIMLELAKIKEMDERKKDAIDKENRKRDLMRQISDEIDKIKAEEKAESEDETPRWVRLVQNAEERKAYAENIRAPMKKLESQPSTESESSGGESFSELLAGLEEADAEALMAELEAEESQPRAKAIQKETPQTSEKDKQKNMEMRAFEESVEAMLELLDDDECQRLAAELEAEDLDGRVGMPKIAKKRSPVSLPPSTDKVAGLRDKLIASKQGKEKQVPRKKLAMVDIQKAKAVLMGQKQQEAKETPKVGSLGSSLKKMFEKKEDPVTLRKAVKKKVIEIPTSPTIDQQLQQAKEKAKAKKWSYQSKTKEPPKPKVKPMLAENDVPEARRGQLPQAKEGQTVSLREEEHEEFLNRVNQFVKSSKSSPDRNDQLKNLVDSYLMLSHDNDEETEALRGSGAWKNKREDLRLITSMSQARNKLQNDFQHSAPKTSPSVGRLQSPEAIFAASFGISNFNDDKKRVAAPPTNSIREKFEKSRAAIQAKKKSLVKDKTGFWDEKLKHLEVKQAPPPSIPVTPAKQEKDWKWKQKIPPPPPPPPPPPQPKDSTQRPASNAAAWSGEAEALERRRRQTMKSQEEREAEFLKLMKELDEMREESGYSEEPSVDFNDAMNAYLKAAGADEKRAAPLKGKKNKPTAERSSAKVNEILNKIQSGQTKQEKRASLPVGKIKPMLDLDKQDEAKSPKAEKDPVLNLLHTDRVKKAFESSNEGESSMKRRPSKKWQPPPKPAEVKEEKKDVGDKPLPKWKQDLLKRESESVQRGNAEVLKEGEAKMRRMDKVIQQMSSMEKLPPMKHVNPWDHITDPEERKRAILAKHGFKPREKSVDLGSEPDLSDVDTIPSHVLNDEILYRRYLRENVLDLSESSSASSSGRSSPARSSVGGLRAKLGRSLSLLSKPFAARKRESSPEEKRRSCSDLRHLWEAKLKSGNKPKPLQKAPSANKLPAGSGKHVENVKNRLKNGEDKQNLVKRFFDRSNSNGQNVKAKADLFSDDQPSYSHEDLDNLLLLFQSGEMSAAACYEYLNDAEQSIKKRYFTQCHLIE